MRQKQHILPIRVLILVTLAVFSLFTSGCGTTQSRPTSPSRENIQKPIPTQIPPDILQRYKRIRSITGKGEYSDEFLS